MPVTQGGQSGSGMVGSTPVDTVAEQHTPAFDRYRQVLDPSAATGNGSRGTGPRIVDLYPNPPLYGDPGEFVTVDVPPGTALDTLELADQNLQVGLPSNDGRSMQSRESETLPEAVESSNGTLTVPDGGPITFSTAPTITRSLTDRAVLGLSDRLQLADAGDTIRLLENGTVVDTVEYQRASVGSVYYPTESDWRPLGATERPRTTAPGEEVEAFVTPDSPDRAVDLLATADERILLAGYTLSSDRVVDELVAASERGVSVEVLVEGSPVGGMTGAEAAALDELSREGVGVQVLDGERARYRHHHAKYAVVDDSGLVTTENWKPAGLGGRSSRGWGVITDQRQIVEGLIETFRADTGWNDSRPWTDHEPTIVDGDSASKTYPAAFDNTTVGVDQTELLVAPDNAEAAILERIEAAEETLDVKQVTISDRNFPFLQAVLDAAERGVSVRILLSGEWYVVEENADLAAWLEEQAREGDLPLSVRIADPGEAFEKIHAKGLIVDGESVLVGSINWNNNSVRHNREVALLLEGEELADYFETVFEADWQETDEETGWHLPLGLGLAVVAGGALAVVVGRRIRFES